MSKFLAIVPAYNEAGAIAGTVDARSAARARLRRARRRRRLDRRDRRAAPRGRARVIAIRSTSASAAPCSPGYQFALENGYDVAVQVDGDGQHDPRHIPACSRTCARTPTLNMVTGSRFLVAHRRRLPLVGLAPARASGSSPASCRWSRGRRVTDPDVGLPHDRPAGDRAVRPRLPARLPRGRGRAAWCTPTGSRARDAGEHARAPAGRSSIDSTQSAYYMIKVLLARARRPAARAPRGRSRRRRARSPRSTRI